MAAYDGFKQLRSLLLFTTQGILFYSAAESPIIIFERGTSRQDSACKIASASSA